MPIDLIVPQVGESITSVEVGEWLRREGDRVERDDTLVTLETDKVTVELPAPRAGRLLEILKRAGESARVGEVIGRLEEAAGEGDAATPARAEPARPEAPTGEDAAAAAPVKVMPAARRLLDEHGLRPEEVQATGTGGRLSKKDVLRHLEEARSPGPVEPPRESAAGGARRDEVVRMTPMRRRIAERLVQAQREGALLTTFNEVDMSAVLALRRAHKDAFQQRYGVKLGLMSFFVKAAIDALKACPALNAEVRGDSVVYHHYYDIGIAVGGGKGLVVPVLRNAERMSFAEVERAIGDFAVRAKDNRLELKELQGGTFTLSNGGVYGSMLSTPIINPPQTGVLGLHAIEDRAVVVAGEVRVRPMMYVALTYDHRVVDGREAVTFLKRIKETVADPARMLLEV